jgi:hypothetical protein
VRPKPIVGDVTSWTFGNGGQPPPDSAVALVGNRQVVHQRLTLPRGRWEISLSWASSIPIDAAIGRRRMVLPPYIGDGERHWRVAVVRGGRTLNVVMQPGPERRFDVPRAAQLGSVAAVRVRPRGHFVPVARACGRYVDWIER